MNEPRVSKVRDFWQFSVKELLLLIVAVAMAAAWFADRTRLTGKLGIGTTVVKHADRVVKGDFNVTYTIENARQRRSKSFQDVASIEFYRNYVIFARKDGDSTMLVLSQLAEFEWAPN